MRVPTYLAAVATAALLFAGQGASAQTAGSTTGPAAGSNVVPNTAVQKDNPASSTGSGVAGQSTEGVAPGAAVGAGAPGSTAKQGTQGGPAPKPAQSQ
jgi:hypothetical protein